MTREEAALAAMVGLLANPSINYGSVEAAGLAVLLADALLAALATPPASAEQENK